MEPSSDLTVLIGFKHKISLVDLPPHHKIISSVCRRLFHTNEEL